MGGTGPDDDLPDGVVPLPRETPPPPGGCGLRGCLYGTVAVFALLLLALVLIALFRQWPTPVVPR
jgi:hypothetical protein